MPVRLPTEAEWECACRAGTTTAYSFGNDARSLTKYDNVYDGKTPPPGYDVAAASAEIKRFNLPVDGYKSPAPVKNFRSNNWNLFDMHGNVAEWCCDGFGNYDAQPQKDPVGAEQRLRVLRGGAWNKLPADCRSAMRFYGLPENKSVSNGFRVVIGRKIKESDKVLPIAVPAVVFPDATPAAPVAAAPAPVPAAPVAGAPVAPLAETCEPVAPVPDGVPVAVPAPAPGAFQWLERAAKAGNVDGLRAIFLFYDGENPEIAGAALEKYATRPDCKDAFVKLAPAVAYAYGFGVEQDAKKAFALYKKAAAADRRRHARRFSALEAARTGRRSGDSLSGRRSGAALGVSQGAERRARRRANRGGRERF